MLNFKGKYGEAIVYSNEADSASISQIYSILNTKQVEKEQVRIMPDFSVGSGCLVGYTQTYSQGGWIDPETLGPDVCCAILACKFKLGKMTDSFDVLDANIRKVIPMGMSINERWNKSDEKSFKKYFKSRLERARSLWPEMIKYEGLGNIEKFITQFCKRIGLDEGIFWKSLGTLGGGNHFIEIAQNPKDKSHAWLVIHTGSRNLGIKVWKYWVNRARKGRVDLEAMKKEEKEIKKAHAGYENEIREKIEALHKSGKHTIPPSKFLTYSEDISGYIEDIFTLEAWAGYNRFLISERIKSVSKGWLKEKVHEIETLHNYIDIYDHIIRKGAIKADQEREVIIPISMKFGSIIGIGLGNEDWNYSAPHGAGRKLSRSEAKRTLKMEDFEEEMEDIFSTSVVPQCIDESPMAYKDPDSILEQIEGTTINVSEIITPLINLKDKGNKGDGREP